VAKIKIDPVTRIEGHLKVETVVEGGKVVEAKSSGMLFRGFELILKDRDPRDAVQITERICGVCSVAHGMASVLCLDNAFGIADKIPDNGRIIRNLICGAHYIHDHILHFYHLAGLDFVDVTKLSEYEGKDPSLSSIKDFIRRAVDAGDMSLLAPFYPRYEGDYRLPQKVNEQACAHYVQAFDARRLGHELTSVFSGMVPHPRALIPGGVTSVPTTDRIANFFWRLNKLREFIDNVYIPDVCAVAQVYSDYFHIGKGCGNYLSYGIFDLKGGRLLKPGVTSGLDLAHRSLDPKMITEDVSRSWYEAPILHPSRGRTEPNPYKPDAYSWIKAPRYDGKVYEVGPLARLMVSYAQGNPEVKRLVDSYSGDLGINAGGLASTMGRHLTRALETKIVADNMAKWILELNPGEPVYYDFDLPEKGSGAGLWEAPRGALGHWIEIKDHKIKNYQCVVPTTWNASPRDSQEHPGPIEQALIGTKVKDEENPFELVRIVRSFDPCIACAVHVLKPKGREVGRWLI